MNALEFLKGRNVTVKSIHAAMPGFKLGGGKTRNNIMIRFDRAGEARVLRLYNPHIIGKDGDEITRAAIVALAAFEAKKDHPCQRCGGARGWMGWPGFKCYRCGGDGTDPSFLSALDEIDFSTLNVPFVREVERCPRMEAPLSEKTE